MDNICAIDFAIDQITLTIEAGADDEYVEIAEKVRKRLYRIMAHYEHLRDKCRK